MLSRQTLGRPAGEMINQTYGGMGMGMAQTTYQNETLNSRAMGMPGGIVTQYNRDNLDDDAGAAINDEIDDLRRE